MTKLLRIFFLRSENIKWILGYSVGNSFNVIFPKDIIYLKKKNFNTLRWQLRKTGQKIGILEKIKISNIMNIIM